MLVQYLRFDVGAHDGPHAEVMSPEESLASQGRSVVRCLEGFLVEGLRGELLSKVLESTPLVYGLVQQRPVYSAVRCQQIGPTRSEKKECEDRRCGGP